MCEMGQLRQAIMLQEEELETKQEPEREVNRAMTELAPWFAPAARFTDDMETVNL
jgi:hypothetical protein